jgi:hypothetical protein
MLTDFVVDGEPALKTKDLTLPQILWLGNVPIDFQGLSVSTHKIRWNQ